MSIVVSAPKRFAAARRTSGPPTTITCPAPRSCASTAADSPTGRRPGRARCHRTRLAEAHGVQRGRHAAARRQEGAPVELGRERDDVHARPQVDVLGPAAEEPVVGRQRDAIDLARRAAGRGVGDRAVPAPPAVPVDVEERDDLPDGERLAVDVEHRSRPISSITPTLTWPGMIGYGTPASWPLARWTSVPHTSLPSVLSRTPPGSRRGRSNVRTSIGAPGAGRTAAAGMAVARLVGV